MRTEEKLNMTMLCHFSDGTLGNFSFEAGFR